MNISAFDSLKRAKGTLAYKVASKMAKKMLDAHVKSCYFMEDYDKIKEINEKLKKAIDDNNGDDFEKYSKQLHYYTNEKPKMDKKISKELGQWDEKRAKARAKVKEAIAKKIKKSG